MVYYAFDTLSKLDSLFYSRLFLDLHWSCHWHNRR